MMKNCRQDVYPCLNKQQKKFMVESRIKCQLQRITMTLQTFIVQMWKLSARSRKIFKGQSAIALTLLKEIRRPLHQQQKLISLNKKAVKSKNCLKLQRQFHLQPLLKINRHKNKTIKGYSMTNLVKAHRNFGLLDSHKLFQVRQWLRIKQAW